MFRARRVVRRRAVVRTAAVGAVAYHAGKKRQQGQEEDYATEDRIAALEAQQAEAQQPAAPAAPAGDSTLEQLEQLAELKERGILTEDEFVQQKARLLGA